MFDVIDVVDFHNYRTRSPDQLSSLSHFVAIPTLNINNRRRLTGDICAAYTESKIEGPNKNWKFFQNLVCP